MAAPTPVGRPCLRQVIGNVMVRLERVVLDVLTDAAEFILRSDNMLEVVSLPDLLAGGASVGVDGTSGHCLKGTDYAS